MTAQNELPKRPYCKGEKKLFSIRLHETLMTEIEKIAEDSGWSTAEVVMTALDQFVQHNKKSKPSK